MAQSIKSLPAKWETWVRSLGQEDLLEKEMPTHSSILAWRLPWTSLVGYSPWGHKESGQTMSLTFTFKQMRKQRHKCSRTTSTFWAWTMCVSDGTLWLSPYTLDFRILPAFQAKSQVRWRHCMEGALTLLTRWASPVATLLLRLQAGWLWTQYFKW